MAQTTLPFIAIVRGGYTGESVIIYKCRDHDVCMDRTNMMLPM